MKKFILVFHLLILFLTTNMMAQLVNINPDPYGDPWICGDALTTPVEVEATIPFLVLTPESANTELPTTVDNSQLVFMPPIFNQGGSGACVQVAEIWYTFAYEINRLRNDTAGDGINSLTNLYHPHYTYNFLNGGNWQSETYYKSGFGIIIENGVPSYEIYDDSALHMHNGDEFIYWMNEHDNYKSGMYNKIDTIENIRWGGTYASIDTLKHWIADHNAGDSTGGLAIISVFIDGWESYYKFLPGTPEGNSYYITQWGTSGGHALTIVGYNDDVQCFDLNNDGLYTNDDLDSNGIVDLYECEKGAFKVANSWGINWQNGNEGYTFIPYKLLAAGLQVNNRAYICKTFDEETPEITVKSNVEYPKRKKLLFKIGYAQNANFETPQESKSFYSFHQQGGEYDMRGAYPGPIESGLDFSYWFKNKDVGKIFFIVHEIENAYPTEGTIDFFSIVDYRWGEEFELPCEQTNIPIVNNGQTILSVDYDLIVPGDAQLINQNTELSTNMVSRFAPTVSDSSILSIGNNVTIDMYNSELIIEPGSSLIIGDSVVFHAKRGVSKISVYGNIQIGDYVAFTADEGSMIELYFNGQSVNISNCTFNNCKINSSANPLTISNSDFTKSFIDQSIRDISVSESIFTNSALIASNLTMQPSLINNSISVTDCNFTTAYDGANSMIEIYGYNNFEIVDNTIDNMSNPESTYHGISVHYSGSNASGNIHEITDNDIYCTYGFCDNDLSGLTIYSSVANIRNNYIHSNKVGIQSLGFSQVLLNGNQYANFESETQRIKYNSLYQVFASSNSFPLEMHYNAIYSSNANDCFVYHNVDVSKYPLSVRSLKPSLCGGDYGLHNISMFTNPFMPL